MAWNRLSLVVGILLITVLCIRATGAMAHHEDIAILREENATLIFVEGEEIVTKVIFSTGNFTGADHSVVFNNTTAYYLTIIDRSAQGIEMPPYNQRIDVQLSSVVIHPYPRPLPEGYWVASVIVRDGPGPDGRVIDDQEEHRFIVKGAEYSLIERQAAAEETNAKLTEQNLFWSPVVAAIAALGGAAAGSIGTYVGGLKLERKRVAHDRGIRWKELYDAHSKLLAEEIANLWKIESGIFASFQIDNNKFTSFDPKEPPSQYTEKVKDHLRLGRPDVWSLYAQGISDSTEIRDRMASIAEQLKETIAAKVRAALPSLTQANIWAPRFWHFYDIESMAPSILNEIKWRKHYSRELVKSHLGKFDPRTGEVLTQLHLINDYLAMGTEAEMASLKQTVDQMLLDPEINGLVDRYVQQEKALAENKNIVEFQNKLSEIVSNIRAGLPIEGRKSCRICRDLYHHIFEEPDTD